MNNLLRSIVLFTLAIMSHLESHAVNPAIDARGVVSDLDVIASVLEQGYSVSLHIKTFHSGLGSHADVSQTAVVKYEVDSTGRVRAESELLGNVSTERYSKEIRVFNGEAVKRLYGPNKALNRGAVEASRRRVFFQGLDPMDFLARVRGKAFSKRFAPENAHILPDVFRWEGRSVVAIESAVKINAGKEWKTRAFVDPARESTLLSWTQLFRFPKSDTWIEYTTASMYGHEQDSSGLWLPRSMIYEAYGVPVEPGIERNLIKRLDIRVTNWIIGPDHPESAFALSFPPNILVDDKVRGETYKTTIISDQMLADQTRLSRGAGTSNGRILILAATVLVTAGLLVVWLIQLRS